METAARQLQLRFESAGRLFAAGVEVAPALAAMHIELRALEAGCALATSHLFLLSSAGEAGKARANVEFARILAAENFAGRVDALVASAEAVLSSMGALRDETRRRRSAIPPQKRAELQRALDVYPGRGGVRSSVRDAGGAPPKVDYDRCPACGEEMLVDSAVSRLRCADPGCGAMRELVGTVFDDTQFYVQEGQKAKSGSFNPNRHFLFWWTHILALEPEEELGSGDDGSEFIIDALMRIVACNRLILRLLTVNDIRSMLQELGRTDLNKNIPLILKKMTGIGPPHLSDEIAARAENLFTKAAEIGELIRSPECSNRSYYPYYMLKILDHILPPESVEDRRVLYYIYIQGEDTVVADDVEWEQICARLPEITYKPTDRSLGLIYRPL